MVELADVFRRFADSYLAAYGATMPNWHRRAIGRKVAVRKTAEDVGKVDHGCKSRSEAGHKLVEKDS